MQVEDIVDTGLTGRALLGHLKRFGPASIKMVTLLSKPSRRKVEFEPEYIGFEIEDRFVVGMGLDYDEMYRSLGCIGVLKQD
jgi:hypoxanthine phosphoribosyltransferase